MIDDISKILREGGDISSLSSFCRVSQFSGNASLAGAVVFFVESNTGSRCVIKCQRNASKCRDGMRSELFAQYRGKSASTLLIPEILFVGNRVYEIQEYISGESLKKKIQLSAYSPFIRGFRIGMGLCDSLQRTTEYRKDLVGNRLRLTDGEIGANYCIVHNDFAPTNIILRNGQAYLIDWDAATVGPACYNYFEYLFHYTSFFVGGRIRRRSLHSYVRVLVYLSSSCDSRLQGEILTNLYAFTGTNCSDKIIDMFSDFLLYRSSATGGHLDDVWIELQKRKDELLKTLLTLLHKNCEYGDIEH